MATTSPQTNGIVNGTQPAPISQPSQTPQPPAANLSSPTTTAPSSNSAPRPRDARLIELLLTSQGVTAYEQRVPLLLLDFAYRHTSSVLSDAIHLSGDPYVTQAGKPSASAGITAPAPGDATVTANAVKLAIGARLSYQFRGGSAGGGISKDYMQELARERNKVALPRIVPNEWGIRLPSERFVLSGTSWGLQDGWTEEDGDYEEGDDMMEGVEGQKPEDEGGDAPEGGVMADVFGEEDVDAEMAEDG